MAITANTPTLSALKRFEVPRSANVWAVNFTSADVTGQEELKAAPGAGKSLYITDIFLTCDDADAHPYLQDANATLLGPFATTVEGVVIDKHFERAVILTANQALNIDAAAAGTVSGIIEGYTANS